jgi:hypothetical protein
MNAVQEEDDDDNDIGTVPGEFDGDDDEDREEALPAASPVPDDDAGAPPPLELPPFRSYNRFRANSRGRFNHLQRLWLKKRIKKSLARDSNADLATLVEELRADRDGGEGPPGGGGGFSGPPGAPLDDSPPAHHHGEGYYYVGVDEDDVSDLHLQVKHELRHNELLAKNRELEKRLRGCDIRSYLGRAEYPLEVRVRNFTFEVVVTDDHLRRGDGALNGSSDVYRIRTVFNSSFVYPIWLWLSDMWRGGCTGPRRRRREYATKRVLDNINLIFEPGKSYLLLGPPGSGRTSLLRAITGILHEPDKDAVRGTISYNGRTLDVG